MSDLLTSLLQKSKWESSRCSLKKSDVSDSLVIPANCLLKRAIRSKIRIFRFFQFLCLRANRSRHSSLICSFVKSHLSGFDPVLVYKRATESDLFTSLFEKEQKFDLLKKK